MVPRLTGNTMASCSWARRADRRNVPSPPRLTTSVAASICGESPWSRKCVDDSMPRSRNPTTASFASSSASVRLENAVKSMLVTYYLVANGSD